MSVLVGDCVEVMAGMEPESVDAVVTDPPYGLEFMGREWDRLEGVGESTVPLVADREDTVYGRTGRISYSRTNNVRCRSCGHWRWSGTPCRCDKPDFPSEATHMQQWHERWATAALRVAKPGAWLLVFGGTRTSHRLACVIEDAGWLIRDTLVWAYAQGFPKSRSSLKPAWEPIILARKPGPLRELGIDACRIGTSKDVPGSPSNLRQAYGGFTGDGSSWAEGQSSGHDPNTGRWPANVILTDPIFDGGWEGVVGGGETGSMPASYTRAAAAEVDGWGMSKPAGAEAVGHGDSVTYSRFFLIPKAPRNERLVDGERSPHPTQKPEALIRHLVKLVNVPPGGVVLDPFLGSGTLGVVCDGLGIDWIGIEREPEYAAWAERRVASHQPEWERTA